MATTDKDITATVWVDVTATSSLVTDQIYTLQNIGASTIEIREATTLPAVSDRGHEMPPGAAWPYTQGSGLQLYVIGRGGNTTYVITEAD